MKKHAEQAIGVFDSGMGGLTLVNALQKVLPGEDIIYFADSEHFPYGNKSTANIQQYVKNISHWLIHEKHCKHVVVACNSASANILNCPNLMPDEHYTEVITPLVDHIQQHWQQAHIGLIATEATLKTQVYQNILAKQNVQLSCQATPLFAPIVEENFMDKPFTQDIIDTYLHPMKGNIDALVLACTHYPLLKPALNQYFGKELTIIDCSDKVCLQVAHKLETNRLLNSQTQGEMRCFQSLQINFKYNYHS